MNLIPWRVRNCLSEYFPLFYHLAVNLGRGGNSPEHWDKRLAETWDDASRNWPTLNRMIAAATTTEQRILDIGCGNGSMLRHLKSLGYRDLSGIDISTYAINRLRTAGIEMHYARLPAVPLPEDEFDVVIASAVLEHIIRRRTFVKEIWRVLKPGGCAMIIVPDSCLGPIDEPEHCIVYTASSLRRFLGRYFDLLTLEPVRDINHTTPVLFATVRKPRR
ncbi:MAG: class I SAM-dependent methyltransferase [Accumulibacter sp.]|jgi:ubiquinone/menaquinone biosynthesis C-methylase UbiE